LTETVTNNTGPKTPAPTSTNANQNNGGDEDEGLGTGSIIGLSVAGGVVVIGIVGFLIWKFTRKRFTDFDDNEAIKWPDLNTHAGGQDSHPLPVHNTGRAGFETGSDGSLTRAPSTTTHSTADLNRDPYAVPPPPHLNPNQPYRDDPMAPTGFYDPYHGPIPGTIENGGSAGPEWNGGGEAYPMAPMAQMGQMGRASPAPPPHMVYDQGYGGMGGRSSPGPQMNYGRASPGPMAAYRTGSPAPQTLAGRASPGPQMAYDGYAAGGVR